MTSFWAPLLMISAILCAHRDVSAREPNSVQVSPTSPTRDTIPLLPEISWPVTFVLKPFRAMLVHDVLFLEGDSVRMEYSHERQNLTMNGVLVKSYAIKSDSMPPSPKERWVREFQVHYRATEGETDRLKRALLKMGHDMLDSSFTPIVSGSVVRVKFRDSEVPWSIHVSAPAWIPPEERAKEKAAFVLKWLSQETTPFVWIVKEFSEISMIRIRDDALDAIHLLVIARERELTDEEITRLVNLRIDLVTASKTRRPPP